MVKQKKETLESTCKSTLITLEDYMTRMIFTLALSLLISGCEDMKMDRKDGKRLQPENQVSQHDEDQAKFLP
jgi:hypothetical protein